MASGSSPENEYKITIIEGPPPVFESVNDGWALALNEGPRLQVPALTRLRTYNGPALVERCYQAWDQKLPIYLHYKNDFGLEQTAQIEAARNIETAEGQVLFLWVRLDADKVEYEIDNGDTSGNDPDNGWPDDFE